VEAHDLRMSRIRSRVLAWATGPTLAALADLASAGAVLAGAAAGPEVMGRDMELVGVRRRSERAWRMRVQTTTVTPITHPMATATMDHTPMGPHMGHMRRQHTGQITGQLCRHPEDMQMDHLHPLEFLHIGPHM
jgi:hypothetical protein